MHSGWTETERAYSPSTCVDSVDALLDAYRSTSRAARTARPPLTHAYGALACERLDVFSAGPGTPVHMFVHGGYWQELSKDDSSFPAPGLLAQGITYIAVDYGLAPDFTLDQIVAQVRSAVAWVHTHASELEVDAARLVLSGSSAGAHLAAMAAVADWAGHGCPADPVGGLVLLSGIYDLEPLVETYLNDAVGMDQDTATRNSPLLHVAAARGRIPTIVAWGEHETAAFKQQSAAFADAWADEGNEVTRFQAATRNHFDIVHDLSDPASALGALVSRLHRRLCEN